MNTTTASKKSVTDMPERIFLGCADTDNEHQVWTDEGEGGTEYVRADLASVHIQSEFRGTVDGDTELQAAARHAGWALIELVDEIDWLKREQVSDIITRLGIALNEPHDVVAKPRYVDCECTKVQQDETCPVGYPSLLCEVCDGKGILPYVKLDGPELWEIVFGIATDAAHEITDEQYSQIADNINRAFIQGSHTVIIPAREDWQTIVSVAARDVLGERRRQIEVEGWTPEHNDEHGNGEMARAALCYITAKKRSHLPSVPLKWPWSDTWWKPDGYRGNLVKAGALILAEIERLDRLAAPISGDQS